MSRKVRQSHQISVSIHKDKDKRITILVDCQFPRSRSFCKPVDSYLASSLSFVFLSAFFNLFIVTFERAVVVQQTLELGEQVLKIVMLLLLLPR